MLRFPFRSCAQVFTIFGALVALTACSAPQAPIAGATAEPTVFVDVTVIPMTGAAARLFGRSVVVENGRITAVGRTGEVAIPAGARLIPGLGRTLAPGLADMCAGPVEASDLASFVLNGVTSVRSGGAMLAQAELAGRVRSGAVLGPQLFLTPTLSGAVTPALSDPTPDAALPIAATAVDATLAMGFEDVQFGQPLSIYGLRALATVADNRDAPLTVLGLGALPVETAMTLGVRALEGMAGFGEAASRRAALRANAASDDESDAVPIEPVRNARAWALAEAEELALLAGYAAHYDVWSCPALTAQLDAAARATTVVGAGDVSAGALTPASVRARWREQSADWDRALAALIEDGAEMRLAALKALVDAQAPLVMGTHTKRAPFIAPGFSIHDEIAHWRAAGVAPADILAAATSQAAAYVGREGEFGVIARGARADLILVEGDPLADLSLLRQPAGVMVAGRWLDAQALRAEARRTQRAARR